MAPDKRSHERIYETVVVSQDGAGRPHVAPMGVRWREERLVLAPFRPSTTLENLLATGAATVNYLTDVRVIAGCLTGRHDWPTVAAEHVAGRRLAAALAHSEVAVERVEDDATRPWLWCREVHRASHAPFPGLNRAQAAVIEAAVLVSRLDRLPADKVDREIDYLTIAVEKTAGPEEWEAWQWLMEAVAAFRGRG